MILETKRRNRLPVLLISASAFLLLADEPTGNLDSVTTHEIMGLLQRLNQGGTTVLMVTDSQECAAYSQRILRMWDGRLIDGNHRG